MMPVHRIRWDRGRLRSGLGTVVLCLAACLLAACQRGQVGTTVRIGYFMTYPPSEIEANILAVIASKYPQLGVGDVKLVGTDVASSWVGIRRGDIDALVEVALPNQQPLVDQAKEQVVLLSEIYSDAVEGFFVPKYVIEGPGAPAAGLRSVDQLGRYRDVFAGKLYDEAPGWESTKYNDMRLKAYGIPFEHVELSDAALIAVVSRAIERRQPIVFFFYHPHWLFKTYGLVKLTEPNPFHPGCFEDGVGRCAIPSFSAWVAARKDLARRAPKFFAMLKNFRIPIGDVEAMMFKISRDKQPAPQVATVWVDAHRSDVDHWVRLATGGA
jgi:glycine betaine/proline transport system substrate-binding protein